MKKRVGIFVILLMLSLHSHLIAGSLDDSLRVVSSDSEGLILEVLTPEPRFQEVWEEGKLYHRMTVSGFGSTTDIGKPQLPIKGVLIGVPDTSKPKIEVMDSEYLTLSGYNIHPVPRPVMVDNDDNEKRILTYEFTRDNEVYNSDAFFPSTIAELGFTGFMRDQRVVQIKLFPFHSHPFSNELLHFRHMDM